MTATKTRIPGLTCSPRFATPLPDVPNYGDEIELVAGRLHKTLMPWQSLAARLATSYDPDTGEYLFDEIDITVPRQSGKTTLVVAKTVHRLVVVARRLGAQRSTYTAQDRASARRKLERDFAEMLRASGRSFSEVEHARQRPRRSTEWRLTLNNGSEAIQFGRGSWWQIETPSETGGHGDTLDDGTIDEAFAHEDDAVEGGMRPTMITRKNAGLWVVSTAGHGRSKYLWRKVLAGREACESGRHGKTAYLEFSAPDDADPGDPKVWRDCSPALGFTITEDAIAAAWERAQRTGVEGINTFRRTMLNQWPEIPVLSLDDVDFKVIPQEPWTAALDARSTPSGDLAWALDLDTNIHGEEWCSIAMSDGRHVEIVTPPDAPAGSSWVVALAAAKVAEITLDPKSAAGKLIDPLEAAGVRVRRVSADEFVQASQQFYDSVLAGEIRHIGQPRLTTAVAKAAQREVGDGAWRFSRKLASADVSPLIAGMLAVWAARTGPAPVDPFAIYA